MVNDDRPLTPVSTIDDSCDMQMREPNVDTGWNGAKISRPELDRLMRDPVYGALTPCCCVS